MKLFKLKPANYPGLPKVITVETDSEFLIGLHNGDATAQVCLFENGTEIIPEDEKLGGFTLFKMNAPARACQKTLVGVFITPSYKTTMNIVVHVLESSVSYIQRPRNRRKKWYDSVEIVDMIGPDSTDDEVPTAKCMYKEIARLESEIVGMDFFKRMKEAGLKIMFYKPTIATHFFGPRHCDDDD